MLALKITQSASPLIHFVPLARRFHHFKDAPPYPEWRSGSPDRFRTLEKTIKPPKAVPWPHEVQADLKPRVDESSFFVTRSSTLKYECSQAALMRLAIAEECSTSDSAFLNLLNTTDIGRTAFYPTLPWGPAMHHRRRPKLLPRLYGEMDRDDEHQVRMLL